MCVCVCGVEVGGFSNLEIRVLQLSKTGDSLVHTKEAHTFFRMKRGMKIGLKKIDLQLERHTDYSTEHKEREEEHLLKS